jgi:hypothetical protein
LFESFGRHYSLLEMVMNGEYLRMSGMSIKQTAVQFCFETYVMCSLACFSQIELLRTFDISNLGEQHSTLAKSKQVVFYTNFAYWLVSRLPANTLDYQEAKFKTSIPLTSDSGLRANLRLLIYSLPADEKSPHWVR